MSESRVHNDKCGELARQRSKSGGFDHMLTGGAASPSASAGAYKLMSSFIDKSFEDGKLDDNEVEGMKVLAGYVPPASSACSPAASTPLPKVTTPPAAPPPMTPKDFMQEVGKRAVQSKGKGGGEDQMIDLSQRLIKATFAQQQAFLGKIDEYLSSGCEIDESEGRRLGTFVDGLFASSQSSLPSCSQPPRSETASHQQPAANKPAPTAPLLTGRERFTNGIDAWEARGVITPEVAQLARQRY